MSKHTPALLAVAFLAALTGCQPKQAKFQVLTNVPAETKEWKFAGHPGKEIGTEHYDIYTTLKDQTLADAVPQVIESSYEFYRFMVPGDTYSAQKLPLFLFATRSEFEAFTKHYAGPRAEVLNKVRNGGYTENGVCVVEYVAHQVTYPIMAHEGLHQYLHFNAKGRVPAWLNEGLAVQCEGQRWGKVGLKEFDPSFNPQRRAELADALEHGDTFPLAELLRIDAGHVIGGSPRKIGGYYGQLWALLLFLQDYNHGQYKPGLEHLLKTLCAEDLETYAQAMFVNSHEQEFSLGENVFRAFISPDLDTVDREFRAYVQSCVLSTN